MSSGTELGAEEAGPAPNVLIVEDDEALAEEMALTLSDYGMRPTTAATWEAAIAAVEAAQPDLVVLDQRLGRVDTLPRIGALRALTDAPVLILTGNRAETDRIVALEIGADDFLLKPISGRELVARIRAHLRRVQQARPAEKEREKEPEQPAAGTWTLLTVERELRRGDGSVVPLTGAEFDLLAVLAEAPGHPVDRETLTKRVLRRPWRPDDRALDNLVMHLRRKLGPGGDRAITAIRSQGYVFTGFPRG
ncbi:response regulator transcription factor [Falsiroseomonas ponticola]|jgi:DNA-binding response OmpR family regulator|uniref:response regulator transcription factor n=1 Tax=Falsiroseomonas ponticola TaxID=2786951 RepID=UPI001CF79B63|nr:response regulator transcription factor [Roseomonas ponticola]